MKHPNTLYTTDDELFPNPRKHKGSRRWIWALAIILASLFVYRSTRPFMQLRSAPPPSFYDYSRSWTRVEREQARRLADAYWQVAVRRIQETYSPQEPLPADPPPQFRISADSGLAASRIHYWNRLRQVWDQPEAWNVSYGWSTGWVGRAVNSLPQYAPQWASEIFQDIVIFFNDVAQRISVH